METLQKQNNKKCIKCKEDFVFYPEETWWDNKTGYSNVKLVKCPFCNCIQSIKYETHSNLNYDKRYYDYRR